MTMKKPACAVKMEEESGEEEGEQEGEEESAEEDECEDLELEECEEEGKEQDSVNEVMIKCLITHARTGNVRAYVQGKFHPSGRKRLLCEYTQKKTGGWNPSSLLFIFVCTLKRLQ